MNSENPTFEKTTTPLGVGGFPIASEYLMVLVNVGLARGMNTQLCLSGAQLPVQVLLNPGTVVGNESIRRVIQNLLGRMHLEELVVAFIEQIGMLNHGALSVAMQSSASILEAIQVAVLYSDTRTAGKILTYSETADYHQIHLSQFAPSEDNHNQVDQFIIMVNLLILSKGFSLLLRRSDDGKFGEVCFNFSLGHSEFICDWLSQYSIRFDANINQVRLRKTNDFIPTIVDRSVYWDAIAECECQRKKALDQTDIESRVRFELARATVLDIQLEAVASALCMCPRSLQRKLTTSGTGFRELKTEEQLKRARYLLLNSVQSVDSIAAQIGYANSSNFIKWFRANVGESPSAFRARDANN